MQLVKLNISLCTVEAPLEFTIPLTEQTCKEGETVTFNCEVSESNIHATWFKYDQELLPSDDVIMKIDGKTHTLTLKNTPLDAAAEYTIRVKGKESSAKLNVQGECITNVPPCDEAF